MHTQSTSRTHDRLIRWPRLYDQFVNVFALGRATRLRQATIDVARIAPGDCVLDAGCGTGDLTLCAKEAAGSQGRVFGIDGAPEMIAVGALKARERGVQVAFSVGRMQELKFENDTFDAVLASLSLHMLSGEDQSVALGEFSRVLKPGGRIVIVDFDRPTTVAGKFVSHFSGHGSLPALSDAYAPGMRRLGFIEIERLALPLDSVAALRATRPFASGTFG